MRRSVVDAEQRANYSGKKRRHTSKVLVVSDENKSITMLSPVYTGSSHDFGMFKNENLSKAIPSGVPVYLDTGFEGIDKLVEDADIRKPKKKPRSRKLNGGERLGNRIISRERVKVEHSIGGFKRFAICSAIFRGITHSMDTAIILACGLWNLRIRNKLKHREVQAF